MKNQTAYEIGQQARKDGYKTVEAAARAEYWKQIDSMSNTNLVFFDAGIRNAEMPYKVTGWRYGKIPSCGFSYNYRDDRPEAGVSLMEVDGGTKTVDMVSAAFLSAGRKVVKVEGYLHTFETGSDGEPLVIDAKEIK